jgi:hypothetical protein
MIIGIECIILCILLTLIVVISTKKNPIGDLHNAHPKIQERVRTLPKYRNLVSEKPLSTIERIKKKLPLAIIVFILFVAIVKLDGVDSFLSGFIYSFILWSVVKLYVVFILDILWYAHSPSFWIDGTKDMINEYRDYGFYLSSIPRSLCAGAIIALIIGGIIAII